jgi:hypothetical protein
MSPADVIYEFMPAIDDGVRAQRAAGATDLAALIHVDGDAVTVTVTTRMRMAPHLVRFGHREAIVHLARKAAEGFVILVIIIDDVVSAFAAQTEPVLS